MYEVWVMSEKSHKWERYTVVPFATESVAKMWAALYLSTAKWEVRPA
jgi:hypothetical protein